MNTKRKQPSFKHLAIIDNRGHQSEMINQNNLELAACGLKVLRHYIVARVTQFGPTRFGEVTGRKPTCRKCDQIRKFPAQATTWGV